MKFKNVLLIDNTLAVVQDPPLVPQNEWPEYAYCPHWSIYPASARPENAPLGWSVADTSVEDSLGDL